MYPCRKSNAILTIFLGKKAPNDLLTGERLSVHTITFRHSKNFLFYTCIAGLANCFAVGEISMGWWKDAICRSMGLRHHWEICRDWERVYRTFAVYQWCWNRIAFKCVSWITKSISYNQIQRFCPPYRGKLSQYIFNHKIEWCSWICGIYFNLMLKMWCGDVIIVGRRVKKNTIPVYSFYISRYKRGISWLSFPSVIL